jgi:glucose/mannose transport system permease protein
MSAVVGVPTARGPKPTRLGPARIGLYAFAIVSAAFFLMPLYVMIVTSFKTMPEISNGAIFALPRHPTIAPWIQAWSKACIGMDCRGISPGFWNSVQITIPSTILSVLLGALNGYALSFWRVRGSEALFAILLIGAFLPFQVFLYPLLRISNVLGLYGTLPCVILVHIIFGLPVMTLMFRNYYAGLPMELFKAARVDGAGFWRILVEILLPMSGPIGIVAVILQVTGIWNDFLFGLIFAGNDHQPMTVALNTLVSSTFGDKPYNIFMAATLLSGAVPLITYFVSGRWFVRGIAAGAVKG